MAPDSCKVIKFREDRELTELLQLEILEVIARAKYEAITNAEAVGVLEFIKWNLINRSD